MSEIHYPGGVRPKGEIARKTPTKKKKNLTIAAGNRGMDFETEINQTNDYYREKTSPSFIKGRRPSTS